MHPVSTRVGHNHTPTSSALQRGFPNRFSIPNPHPIVPKWDWWFRAAKYGDDVGVLDAMRQAIILDPIATLKGEEAVLGAYRPRQGQTLPEEARRLIIKRMKVDPDELYPQAKDPFSQLRNAEWERRVHAVNLYRKRRPRSP